MIEEQRQHVVDEEHLRLLRLAYLVNAGIDLLAVLIALPYIGMGVMFRQFRTDLDGSSTQTAGPVNADLMSSLFIGGGVLFALAFLAMGALQLYTARAIGRRRSKGLCMATAAFTCLAFPYGTMLGVATFAALSRPSIAALFDTSKA